MKVTMLVLCALIALTVAQGGRPGGGGGKPGSGGMGRPGNNDYCDGKCATPCATGQVCQFQFNGMGQKPTCGCAVPRTRPSRPGTRPTRPPGPRPTRTMPGMRACADIHQASGSTPEDEASCDSWSLCKQHRRTPTFVPGTGDEEDSCCCSEPSDNDEPAGDKNQFCCAITSAPEPTTTCSIMDVKPCSQGFATAAIACKSAITDSKNCNIMADPSSQAYKDCTEIFDCMHKSFGKNFGKCCNCINAFASKFKEAQFQLDCTAA